MSLRAATRDRRGRRLVAPVGLVVAVAILVATTWSRAGELQVEAVAVPVAIAEAEGAIPPRGPIVAVTVTADALTPDVVELVDTLSRRTAEVPGVVRVESVTATPVVVTGDDGLGASPAFGATSQLDPGLGPESRAQRAAAGRLGTAGLLTADGRTLLVAAELDPALSAADQASAARAVRDHAALAVSVAGVPVDVGYGGEALTVAESTERARTDLWLLVGLACVAPAAITLVVLRRRVPAGGVLAAGGAALLLAAVLINGEVPQGRVAPLDQEHPVTKANDLIDRDLRGTVPVTVDLAGAPGTFARADVMARMDALTTWLRSEYGIVGVDLPTTMRAEAGAITGVDSVPGTTEDIENLLGRTEQFAPDLVARIVNGDRSRTRIVAWLPDEGRARLDELANRLDRMSQVVFDDLGIAVDVSATVVAVAPARQDLARDLALLGALAIALGAGVALATAWDRHRHEERHRAHHRRLVGPGGRHPAGAAPRPRPEPEDVPERQDHDRHDHRWDRSLFARLDPSGLRGASPTPATRSPRVAPEPTDPADRFEPPRRSDAASRS